MTDTTAIPQALIGYIDEEAECIRLKKRNEITAPIAVLLIDEAKLKAWKMFLPDELEKHAVHNKYRQSCRLFSRVSNLPEGVKELSSGDVKAVFSDYPLPIPIGEVWSGNPSDELPVVDYADVAKLFGEEVPRAVSEHR